MRQLIKLDTPDKNGKSERQHIESAIKQYKKLDKNSDELSKQLEPVPLKQGSEYLLRTFLELSRARASDMNGPCPISYQDIKAYCDLMDERLDPWEVEVLQLIDTSYIDEAHKQSKD